MYAINLVHHIYYECVRAVHTYLYLCYWIIIFKMCNMQNYLSGFQG